MMPAEPSQDHDALRVLSCAQMAAADRATVARGQNGLELMERAGRAVAEVATDMTPGLGRVLVLAGPGNNGGDGFVAARHLAARGRDVVVALIGSAGALGGDAAAMARRWTGKTIELVAPLTGDVLAVEHDEADLVIDALFGAGLSRPIAADSLPGRVIATIAARGLPVLAVDLPSGVDGDTGAVGGVALPATRTVTFFRRKPGHLLLPGRELCGPVDIADIGIPPDVLDEPAVAEPATWINARALWSADLAGLPADSHKYRRGHAFVISGGIAMSGAARLAAGAALRAGAGLVTIAAPPEAMLAHGAQLSAILLREGQTPDAISAALVDRRITAVVIGPGLGVVDGLARVRAALAASVAVVLDADALTAASEASAEVFADIARRSPDAVVMTPHQGEFARLFPAMAGSKLERAREAARVSASIIVLKGPDTVIAAPDGRAVINASAPPALATAGSGDVLAGIIGSLLAQGVPAFEAAVAAVWLHGEAGNRLGPGLISEDLVDVLPTVLWP